MNGPMIDDALWARIEPLLPPPPGGFGGPGRPMHPRQALEGILYVLAHRLRWGDLPPQLGYGAGRTCQRTLWAWREAGAWPRVQEVLKAGLADAGHIDWARASEPRRGRPIGGPLATPRAPASRPRMAMPARTRPHGPVEHPRLGPVEQHVLEALGGDRLSAAELARRSGLPCDERFTKVLGRMRAAGVVGAAPDGTYGVAGAPHGDGAVVTRP